MQLARHLASRAESDAPSLECEVRWYLWSKLDRFSDAGNGRLVKPQLPGSERLSLRTGIATPCLSLALDL